MKRRSTNENFGGIFTTPISSIYTISLHISEAVVNTLFIHSPEIIPCFKTYLNKLKNSVDNVSPTVPYYI